MAPVTRALLQAKTVYLYYRINFSGKVNLRSCLHGLKLVILDESIKGLPDYKLKQLPIVHDRKLVMCIQPRVAQTHVTREGV